MKFEHLIQINDSKAWGIEPLSRQQLWLGLVARAWYPTKFVLGLEQAEVLTQTLDGKTQLLTRKLDFGAFHFEDEVQLIEEDRTINRIRNQQACPDSTLTIAIEEPQSGDLFLRFTYEISETGDQITPDGVSLAQLNEVRRQAYLAADIDTVKMIRELSRLTPHEGLAYPNPRITH